MISLPGSPIQIEHIVSISRYFVEVIFLYTDAGERDIKVFANADDVWDKISDPASYPSEPVDESTCTENYPIEMGKKEWLTLMNWCDRYHIALDKWVRAMMRFYIDPENREIVKQVVSDGREKFGEIEKP